MRSYIILFVSLLSVFLTSCDMPLYKSQETSAFGEEYYEKLGLPPELVDQFSPDQIMELIQFLNRREERLSQDPNNHQSIDLYADLGLPSDISNRMEGHQILEYLHISEEWLRMGLPLNELELYRTFGLPRELANRFEGHQILEYMQAVKEIQRQGISHDAPHLYEGFGLPQDLANRMEPHEIMEYMQVVANLSRQGLLPDGKGLTTTSLYERYDLPKEQADRMEPHEIMEYMHRKSNAHLEDAHLAPEIHKMEAMHEMEAMNEMHAFPPSPGIVIGVIGLFAFMVILLVGLSLFLNYKKSVNLHDLMYHSIKEGKEVPYEAIRAASKSNDFRNGMILVGLGLGLILFFFSTHGPIMIGVIPFFIGLGYLIVGRMIQRY